MLIRKQYILIFAILFCTTSYSAISYTQENDLNISHQEMLRNCEYLEANDCLHYESQKLQNEIINNLKDPQLFQKYKNNQLQWLYTMRKIYIKDLEKEPISDVLTNKKFDSVKAHAFLIRERAKMLARFYKQIQRGGRGDLEELIGFLSYDSSAKETYIFLRLDDLWTPLFICYDYELEKLPPDKVEIFHDALETSGTSHAKRVRIIGYLKNPSKFDISRYFHIEYIK